MQLARKRRVAETNDSMTAENDNRPDDSLRCRARHPLTWSAEKPKRRGWWWVEMPDGKGNVGIAVRKVEHGDDPNRMCVYAGTLGWVALVSDTVNGWRWAGPLAEPLEPAVITATKMGLKAGGQTP